MDKKQESQNRESSEDGGVWRSGPQWDEYYEQMARLPDMDDKEMDPDGRNDDVCPKNLCTLSEDGLDKKHISPVGSYELETPGKPPEVK